MLKTFTGVFILAVATAFVQLAFWLGLIYFGFWCLQHFNII